MNEKYEKELEEFNYKIDLFKAILYYSRTKNSFRFPTINEYVLSEVINGTIDYLNGNAGGVTYKNIEDNERNRYVRKIFEYFEEETKDSIKKLDPKVREALISLVGREHVSIYTPGFRSYDKTNLYDRFKTYICHETRSIFSLSEEILKDVEEKIIPKLHESELNNIKGIGKSMRKYVDEDLEYIQKNYWW